MNGAAPLPSRRPSFLLLVPLVSALLLPGCTGRGETAVAGIASWRGMGIEGARLRAVPEGEGAAAAPVTGRTTYHGAFVLPLPPGRWRVEAEGEVPFGKGTAVLSGSVSVEVPAGARRVDRVAIALAGKEGR